MSFTFWREVDRGSGMHLIANRVLRTAIDRHTATCILSNGTRILNAITSMYDAHWRERYMDGGGAGKA